MILTGWSSFTNLLLELGGYGHGQFIASRNEFRARLCGLEASASYSK